MRVPDPAFSRRPEPAFVPHRSGAAVAPAVGVAHQALPGLGSFWDRLRAAVDRLRYLGTRRFIHAALKLAWFPWHRLLRPEQPHPPPAVLAEADRRFQRVLELDLRNVETGVYPRELLFDSRFNEHLGTLPELLRDVPRIVRRSRSRDSGQLPPGMELERYPAYYRQTFHWQTDGWLSPKSARLYDVAVDALFLGSTDAMRRMALAPVAEAVRALRSPRILDVACGSGRFLAQLHGAIPRARLCGLDLSPFYIRHAARTLGHIPRLELVAENAEAMPFVAGEFDALTSVFLFHELPREARRQVVREMKRVLRPGGRVAICDSIQRTDASSAGIAFYLDWFPAVYHEPYYEDYSRDDLGALLAECSFEVEQSECHYFSKVVTARAPLR